MPFVIDLHVMRIRKVLFGQEPEPRQNQFCTHRKSQTLQLVNWLNYGHCIYLYRGVIDCVCVWGGLNPVRQWPRVSMLVRWPPGTLVSVAVITPNMPLDGVGHRGSSMAGLATEHCATLCSICISCFFA